MKSAPLAAAAVAIVFAAPAAHAQAGYKREEAAGEANEARAKAARANPRKP